MVERVRNIIKRDRKRIPCDTSVPATKKAKVSPETRKKDGLLRRYPIGVTWPQEDGVSFDQHMRAIAAEMNKAKPRDTVILPLMKSTYRNRRMFIENDAKNVQEILNKCCSALKRPAVVCFL